MAPALNKAEEMAKSAYDTASQKISQVAQENKDKTLGELAQEAKDYAENIYSKGKKYTHSAVEKTEDFMGASKEQVSQKAKELGERSKEEATKFKDQAEEKLEKTSYYI